MAVCTAMAIAKYGDIHFAHLCATETEKLERQWVSALNGTNVIN